ncbi:unnamed protein product [Tenebrio molitor]|nr:unnamed protein product [Tenebrio molitor]
MIENRVLGLHLKRRRHVAHLWLSIEIAPKISTADCCCHVVPVLSYAF